MALLKRSKEIDKVDIVGSAFATNEDNYLLYKVFHDELGCNKFYVYNNEPQGEDVVYKSGFTIYADKSPNQVGAKLILGEKSDFWDEIKKGNIEVLYFLNGDIDLKLTDQQKELLKKLDFLIVQDVAVNDLVKIANVVLPSTYFAEHSGSFVNVNGQVQKIQAAIKPPGNTLEGWKILVNLYKMFNEDATLVTIGDVVNDMAQHIEAFKDISFFKIGVQGINLEKATV